MEQLDINQLSYQVERYHLSQLIYCCHPNNLDMTPGFGFNYG